MSDWVVPTNDIFLHRHIKAHKRGNDYPLVDIPTNEVIDIWVASINQQREGNKDQPYLSPLLPWAGGSKLSLYSIGALVSMGGYKYSGLKVLGYSLYRDRYIITTTGMWDDHTIIGDSLSVGDLDADYQYPLELRREGPHWEFVKGGAPNDPIINREYLYLPVAAYTGSVMELIPSIGYWKGPAPLRIGIIGTLIPDRELLLPSNHKDYGEWYNTTSVGVGTSPLLPGLTFTGAVVVLGDGELLYEYQDLAGTYSMRGMLYMSPLRPDDHQYPLGRPKPGDLILDDCIPLGGYPHSATLPWVGRSTGYKTTDNYHPTRTYYLYEDRYGGTFLHESPPSKDVWPLIEELLGDGGIGIEVPCVTDRLYIEDSSCGVALILPDLLSVSLYDGYIWDDCTMIGDDYDLVIHPCVAYWDDSTWIDDYYYIDPCADVSPTCA
jgi:hypothetical protein